MSAYDDLMAFQRDTEALGQIAGRLGWDQETMMPSGATEQRAAEMGAMEGVLHGRRVDPRIGDWLAAIARVSWMMWRGRICGISSGRLSATLGFQRVWPVRLRGRCPSINGVFCRGLGLATSGGCGVGAIFDFK